MKTALQELIEYVDNPMKSNAISKLELVFYLKNTLLEKEKEQICNAYTDGLEGPYLGAEEYYNQTYNQEPKKEYQPSEEYLKKQRELMEDFVWNKMNNNNI